MRNQSDSSPIRELEWSYGKSQAEYGKKKSGKSAGFGIKRLVNQGWFLKSLHLIGHIRLIKLVNQKPGSKILKRCIY